MINRNNVQPCLLITAVRYKQQEYARMLETHKRKQAYRDLQMASMLALTLWLGSTL